MIVEEYKEKEFHIDEKLWNNLMSNFRKNLELFKQSHKQNYVTLLMPVSPIDFVKFVYEELKAAHLLEKQNWPLVIDDDWVDSHYHNFAVEIVVVDEQEREMGDGNIIVFIDFVYEESNW